MGERPRTVVALFCTELSQERRATAASSILVKLESKCIFFLSDVPERVADRLGPYRNVVPEWVKSEEAKEEQKKFWDAIAQELEAAKPGCVKATL